MNFTETLRNACCLSPESISVLMENTERIVHPKHTVILSEGDRDTRTGFVETGLIRCSVLRDGKPVTLRFACEGEMIGTVPGFLPGGRSPATLETLEETVLLYIPRTRMEALFAESVELANWGRRLVEKQLVECERYFTEYYWQDKKTQYLRLLGEYPDLLRRVPLKDLASYLDVTPQSLSRIRSRIR